MSICCCFFFRDYGGSKRKSGKGVSALFSLTSQLPARTPLILQQDFRGRGDACLACWPRDPVCWGMHPLPLPDPRPLSSLPLSPSFSLVPLAPGWEVGVHGVGDVSGRVEATAASSVGPCTPAAGATAGSCCGFPMRPLRCGGRVCGYAGSCVGK